MLFIKSKGSKRTELVVFLGIIWGIVNLWLSGKQVPGHKPLMKIFELFPDISSDWLLIGKGEMSIENEFQDSDEGFYQKQLKDQTEVINLYKKLLEEKDA